MKFEKDVFISYAHLDDKPLDESTKGWITNFHKLLQTRLEQIIGHELNIWRDERLTGNEVFAPEIVAQFPKLKAMVSIITPRYIQSDWCRQELELFYKAATVNGGISIDNKSRIFKVVKTPVDKEEIGKLSGAIHKVFDEILDYKFYRHETTTGRFKELAHGSWVESRIQQEFMDKLDDVVQDIANIIKKLNRIDTNTISKRKIYLAETTYDLQAYRDNIAREIEEGGFIVLPDKNLPYVADRFTSSVKSFLDDSVLSVHVISSTNYSLQPEGSDKSTVILQNEIAAQKSAVSNLNRLIWIPPAAPGAVAANENMGRQQKAFVENLKRDAASQQGADILEGTLEEFKYAIFDTIRKMDAEEKAKHEAEEKLKATAAIAKLDSVERSGEPKLVYLICDPRDLDDSRPLENTITDSGNEILFPFFEGDQAQLRAAHLDNLKICDAVIIYYGAANYRWTNSMKSDLLRLSVLNRAKPLLHKAVYIAGTPDKDKETFKATDFEIINGLSGHTDNLFDHFIQKLA